MIAEFGIFLGGASQRFILFMTKEIIYSAVLFIPLVVLAVMLRKKSPIWELGLLTLVLIRLVLPPGFSIPALKFKALDNIKYINKIRTFIPELNTQERQKSSITEPAVFSINNTSVNSAIPFWQIAVFGVWLVGFLFTLAVHIKRYLYFRRIVSNAAEMNDQKSHAVLAHWQKVFRIKRKIRAVYSNQCLSPFTTGIVKPVIYLPKVLLESNDAGLLNSVFAHEMAHIKHFDDLWIKFQNLIQSLYFFYPVVWYVNSRIFLARECLRDSLVISKGNLPPKSLGQGILSLAKMNFAGSDHFLYLPGFGSAKRKVSLRLRNLETAPVSISKKTLIYTCLVFIGAFILPSFAAVHTPKTTGGNTESLGFSHVPPNRGVNTISQHPLSEVEVSVSSESPENFFEPIYPEATSRDIPLILPDVKPSVPSKGERKSVDLSVLDIELPPVRLDEQYTPPRLIKRVKPDYPVEARQRRVEGTVVLEATTDEYGTVRDVKVQRSIPVLDRAAVEAVRQWIYEPMIINGRPRKVIFKVTVHFKMERPSN